MAHNELEGELIAETGYSKFLNMMNEKKLTTAEQAKKEEIVTSLKPKYGKTSKTYAIATSVAKKVAEEAKCETSDKNKNGEDERGEYAKNNLIKNRIRAALGVKNPIIMTAGYEPEGEMVDEATRAAREGVPETHRPGLAVDRRVANQDRETPGGRRALKREADARRQQQTPEAQEAKRQRDDESDKIKRINKRPRTKKERADYEGVRRAGNLGS
jgi:hypothetical protein